MEQRTILLIGGGGREHAIAWKLSQSPLLLKLYIAPGNAGTEKHGTNLPVSPLDFGAIREAVLSYKINMVVVGPEDPLVEGIFDFFLSDPILSAVPVIGPSAAGALLEGSKAFAKGFMNRNGIPTAAYQEFTKETLHDGYDFLDKLSPPYVLKADGLAAGKGVLILDDVTVAKRELKAMVQEQKFGAASKKVVIEAFLKGIELSVFVITDGDSYLILPEAKDYKRINDGDTGPNTGGMGTVSPVPFADDIFMERVEKEIIIPTIMGLKKEDMLYRGFIFFGLMKVGHDPYVIEYNVRLGDPEAESVLVRVENDLVALFNAVVDGSLKEQEIVISTNHAVTVMLVSGGYPGTYEKGKPIVFPDAAESIVFHAGTKSDGKVIATNGGRVLGITSLGESLQDAIKKTYQTISMISFENIYYRKDIGNDLLAIKNNK